MKIISGLYKNTSLNSPHSTKTHPMGSREKLALFNMLSNHLEGATVLDAFAGSGALGLEALSRGAKSVTFVEQSPKIAKTIRENLSKITPFHPSTPSQNNPNRQIVVSSVENFTSSTHYDLILADPPYDNFKPNTIAQLINLLNPGKILALSHPGPAPDLPGATLLKTKTYASAHLSIYQKASPNQA